jgi:hypothetical protein
MSDRYFILIAEDAKFEPDEEQLELAREFLEDIAGECDETEVTHSGELEFFDCGENFEEVKCPRCGRELFKDWWQEQFDVACRGEGIQLKKLTMPCCDGKATLHELHYDMPQGFGTFSVQAMNPEIDDLDEDQKAELEQIVGTKLRVIWQRV